MTMSHHNAKNLVTLRQYLIELLHRYSHTYLQKYVTALLLETLHIFVTENLEPKVKLSVFGLSF